MYRTTKDSKQPKQSWEERTKWRHHIADWTPYHKTIVITTVRYWKNRSIDKGSDSEVKVAQLCLTLCDIIAILRDASSRQHIRGRKHAVKVKVTQSCPTLRPRGLYSPWNSPGQHTGVGSLSLLQGIFPTQGSNLGLPHCRHILYQLSHKGSPRILE